LPQLKNEAARLMDSASHTPSLDLATRLMKSSQGLLAEVQSLPLQYRRMLNRGAIRSLEDTLDEVEEELLPDKPVPITEKEEPSAGHTVRNVATDADDEDEDDDDSSS